MKQIRPDLSQHETDLYQQMTCIMKQVRFDLLHHETDLDQNMLTHIIKQVGSHLSPSQ